MNVNRKRNKTLTVRLTEDEKNAIAKKAKQAHMSLTEYIVTLSNIKPIFVAEDVKPVIGELKRIGNNINQITVKINAGIFSSYNFQDVIDELYKIYREVYEIARK